MNITTISQNLADPAIQKELQRRLRQSAAIISRVCRKSDFHAAHSVPELAWTQYEISTTMIAETGAFDHQGNLHVMVPLGHNGTYRRIGINAIWCQSSVREVASYTRTIIASANVDFAQKHLDQVIKNHAVEKKKVENAMKDAQRALTHFDEVRQPAHERREAAARESLDQAWEQLNQRTNFTRTGKAENQ